MESIYALLVSGVLIAAVWAGEFEFSGLPNRRWRSQKSFFLLFLVVLVNSVIGDKGLQWTSVPRITPAVALFFRSAIMLRVRNV